MLDALVTLAQVDVRDAGSGATTCVGKNETFCWDYAIDNIGDYVTPTLEHIFLVVASVIAGFVVALGLAVISHRRRWLVPVFVGSTGILYTIPSIALFFLLLPVSGRGTTTAVIGLTLYNLQIIYRNVVAGLANVPGSAKDAGRGMGMTDRQLFWKVEMPLAVPEIIAGVRIATVSTVAIATLAVFAGAGGLGDEIYNGGIQRDVFKTGIVIPSAICIALAIGFDGILLVFQRVLSPWRKVRTI